MQGFIATLWNPKRAKVIADATVTLTEKLANIDWQFDIQPDDPHGLCAGDLSMQPDVCGGIHEDANPILDNMAQVSSTSSHCTLLELASLTVVVIGSVAVAALVQAYGTVAQAVSASIDDRLPEPAHDGWLDLSGKIAALSVLPN